METLMKSRNEFTTNEEYNEYLRIYFAGLAMQGLLSSFMYNAENGFYGKDVVVSTAIEYADELLKQLENE